MTATVINIRMAPANWRGDPRYAYVGRAGHGIDGYFGNRHTVGYCAVCRRFHTRGAAIDLHEVEAGARFRADAEFRERVLALDGKMLVCFCAPLRCHAEVYVKLLEENR